MMPGSERDEILEAALARIAVLEREVQQLREATIPGGRLIVPRAVTTPPPSEITRGVLYVAQGAPGAADVVRVVLKAAADTYSAITVATG